MFVHIQQEAFDRSSAIRLPRDLRCSFAYGMDSIFISGARVIELFFLFLLTAEFNCATLLVQQRGSGYAGSMTENRPDVNLKPRLNVISHDTLEEIHDATLELLERTGIKIKHPEALDLLDGIGASVDNQLVHIPAWLVEESVRKAPSRVVLGRRNGERSVILERDRSWFGPTLDCMDYLVPFTAERRPFTLEDCRTTTTVLDALPNYHWGLTFGLARDVPANVADRVVFKEALQYTQKPLVVSCKDINSLHDIYEMVTLIAGNEKRFRYAPNIAILVDPISPMLLSNDVVDKIMFCARKGIPQICFSAPQSGSTAPATLAGTIVEASAESLAGIVLAQAVNQGAPVIYGGFPTVMDMRTTIFSYGAPEMSLMSAAMAGLSHYYRLPCFGTAGCSDSKLPDSQAAAEATYSCFSSSLSGSNMIHDSGLLDHGSMVSPAFMVLVSEILEMIKYYMRGILVNDDTLALEVIHNVGPGGHFIAEKHTADHYREVWYSNLFDRSLYETWLERGGRRFQERLIEQTQTTMEHQPEPLPETITEELERMASHWK